MAVSATLTAVVRESFTQGGENRYGVTSDTSYSNRGNFTNNLSNAEKVLTFPGGDDSTADITDFYYQYPSNKVVLILEDRVSNTNWNSVISLDNETILYRKDATFEAGQGVGAVSTWTWQFPDSDINSGFQFFTRDNSSFGFQSGETLTFKFLDRQEKTVHNYIVSKDALNAADEARTSTATVGNLLAGTDLQGIQFDIPSMSYTSYPGPTNSGFPTSSGAPNHGPTKIDSTNCRVYYSTGEAKEIGVSGGDTYFRISGHMFGIQEPTPATYTEWQDSLEGQKIISEDGTFRGTITSAQYNVGANNGRVMDIDLNGDIDALTDGLLYLRFLFGLTGDALIEGAVALDAVRTTADQIEAYISDTEIAELLDFDGNGVNDALTDGLIFLRVAFGLTGTSLTESAVANDSPLTHAEVAAEVERVYALFDPRTTSSDPSNPGVDGHATITYEADDDSIRDFVPPGMRVYVEADNNITLFNNPDTYVSSSLTGWSRTFNAQRSAVVAMRSAERQILVEPLNSGHFSTTQRIVSRQNRNTDIIIQNYAGPSHTITMNSLSTTSNINTITQEEYDMAPYGADVIRWRISTKVTGSDPDNITIEENNCVIDRKESITDALAPTTPTRYADLVITPGQGGKRYSAVVTLTYRSKTQVYKVFGRIRGVPQVANCVFPQPLSSSVGSREASNNSSNIVGHDGLRLRFDLNTNYSTDTTLSKFVGLLATATVQEINGGTVVNRSGVIKAKDTYDKFDLIHDSCIFIPNSDTDFWSVTLHLPVKVDDDGPSNIRTYIGQWSGTYSPEFGLEVISSSNESRLTSLVEPLRYVLAQSGTLTPQREVTEEFDSVAGETNYYPDGGAPRTGWYDTARFGPNSAQDTPGGQTHTVEVWWQGTLIKRFTHSLIWAQAGGPTNQVQNNDLFPGVNFEKGNVMNANTTDGAWTGATIFATGFTKQFRVVKVVEDIFREKITYSDSERFIPINDEIADEEDAATYAVINNEPNSMVGARVNADNNRVELYATDWNTTTQHTANFLCLGPQDDYLSHKYAIQVLKIGD